MLDFGQVIATGTSDEVRNNAVVQEAYLGHANDVEEAGEAEDT